MSQLDRQLVYTSLQKYLNSRSLGESTEMEGTQMEMFNFLWLFWVHYYKNHSRSQKRTDQMVLVLTYIEIFSSKKKLVFLL